MKPTTTLTGIVVFSLIMLTNVFVSDAFGQCSCMMCNGTGAVYRGATKVTEYEKSMIWPGDKNWMRGYTYYVHTDKATTRYLDDGGYYTCSKCNGSGLECDPSTISTYYDQYELHYLSLDEGMLRVLKRFRGGAKDKVGIANANKQELVPPIYDDVTKYKHGLAVLTRYSDYTQALVDRNGRILVPCGPIARFDVGNDGSICGIKSGVGNTGTSYYVYDGNRLIEGRAVKRYEYRPDPPKLFVYESAEFIIDGKKFYGLAQSSTNSFLFPPVYESLELKTNSPEDGVLVVLYGKKARIYPHTKDIDYIPNGYESYSKLDSKYYLVKKNGKFGLFSEFSGVEDFPVIYDSLRKAAEETRRVQSDIGYEAVLKGKQVFLAYSGEQIEKKKCEVLTTFNKYFFKVRDNTGVKLIAWGGRTLDVGPITNDMNVEVMQAGAGDDYMFKITDGPTKKCALIRTGGDVIVPGGLYDEMQSYGKTLIVAASGKKGLYDAVNKRELLAPMYKDIQPVEGDESQFMVRENGKTGVWNVERKALTIPCMYDEIVNSSKTAKVFVRQNGKWGAVNDDNSIYVPIEFDEITYTKQFIVVKQDGKYGFYHKKSSHHTDCDYDSYKEGYDAVVVTRSGHRYRLNSDAEEVDLD